jgi:hypothetical protein
LIEYVRHSPPSLNSNVLSVISQTLNAASGAPFHCRRFVNERNIGKLRLRDNLSYLLLFHRLRDERTTAHSTRTVSVWSTATFPSRSYPCQNINLLSVMLRIAMGESNDLKPLHWLVSLSSEAKQRRSVIVPYGETAFVRAQT